MCFQDSSGVTHKIYRYHIWLFQRTLKCPNAMYIVPVLSAQFMTAPTGSARDIRNLAPTAPPRPRLDIFYL